MDQTPMVFEDLAPIEVQVKIGQKDYVLCECSEGDAVKWRNAQTKTARFSQDGKNATLGDIASSEPLLVSMCLWELLKDSKRRRVPLDVVNTWKPRIVKELHERAMEISGLREVETEATVLKRIAADKKRLEVLRAPKNGELITTDTSS